MVAVIYIKQTEGSLYKGNAPIDSLYLKLECRKHFEKETLSVDVTCCQTSFSTLDPPTVKRAPISH